MIKYNLENIARMKNYLEDSGKTLLTELSSVAYNDSNIEMFGIIGYCSHLDLDWRIKTKSAIFPNYFEWCSLFTGIEIDSITFKYLFSLKWHEFDNSIKSSLKRFSFVLNGKSPEIYDIPWVYPTISTINH